MTNRPAPPAALQRIVIVEGVSGAWRVTTPGRPLETFERRADAVMRAAEIASTITVLQWTIIVEPAPGPDYK
jgi:hypothetical protein